MAVTDQPAPAARRRSDPAIGRLGAAAFTFPTEEPESDGTLAWESTTLVVAEAEAGGATGIGYTYSDPAVARLIAGPLRRAVVGGGALAVEAAWWAMLGAVRNLGRPGLAMAAVSAVDAALWDLLAKLLGLPLVDLLGAVRPAVPVYGSGGFTSYGVERLSRQLAGWVGEGIGRVKMKVGREPDLDPGRVAAARRAIDAAAGSAAGPGGAPELFVDANGAYDRKRALALAGRFAAEAEVSWFEEPVSSDDLEGLALLRDRAPAGIEVAAGEYGWDLFYFRRMLEAGAVDVLQADAGRCGGVTGFLKAAVLCEARSLPLSAHTAPALHLAPCCAAAPVRHLEWFWDHVRLERTLFDGVAAPRDGALAPDRSRPGMGIELKRADAERWQVFRDDG